MPSYNTLQYNSKLVCQHTTQCQINFRFVNAVITVVAFSLLNLPNIREVLTFKSVNKLGRSSVTIQIKPLWTAVLLFVCFFFSILYKIHLFLIFTMFKLI